MGLAQLPIDSLIPAIAAHLRRERNLVIEAPPGAGKTTRVPPALLDLGGRAVVLEPRRLAARVAARRVAAEHGERLGETVGYRVRFDEAGGPRTRLWYVTEGVLTRQLLSDPELRGVGTVVLDEFHERHLEGDLALALLRRLQRTRRPDLRVVVMSATLEPAPVAAYLCDCAVVRSGGRQYELTVEYTPHSADALEQQVAAALERLCALRPRGHVLVFLPGAAEIRRSLSACEPFARRAGFDLLALHGDQSPEEQDRAVAPSARPKIVLSTNVAESSITIEGISAVIDSGLARVAGHSPWSGLPTLRVARISQASANQRAGRAGRTGPGHVIRLYPREDFVRRPAQDVPEIARADLAPAALELRAMGVRGLEDLEWLDAPPAAAAEQADVLLRALGAIDAQGGITNRGHAMAGLPLHPRLARLVEEAVWRSVEEDGYAAAAVLSSGERLPPAPRRLGRSDVLALMESDWQPYTSQVLSQVRSAAAILERRRKPGAGTDDDLLMAVLVGFPDRVARRRPGGELQLASGGAAVLSPSSTVQDAGLLVTIEVEDRRDGKLPMVRLASAVEPEWLLDLFPDRIAERTETVWNRSAERVEAASALYFGAIALDESRGFPDPEAAARLLAEKALEGDIERFAEREPVDRFLARVNFAAEYLDQPRLGEEQIATAVVSLCRGLTSFAELRTACAAGGLVAALERQLPAGSLRRVDILAPERIRLPGGRNVAVHYEPGKPPWIASRLQDFFGMRETPRVAGGRVPVVVHLLAPNQRPVQMTTDLAGFWKRLYPEVRRELSRRYPKHAWPPDPLQE